MFVNSKGDALYIFEQDGPIKKELPSARAGSSLATDKRKKNEDIVTKSRLERWKLSGVIALSDCGLTVHKAYIEHETRWTFNFMFEAF